MTSYSFGNRWVGIAALKDPPSAAPEPLHEMALRLRSEASGNAVRLGDGVIVGPRDLHVLLERVHARFSLQQQWSRADAVARFERALRSNGRDSMPSWLRRALLVEHQRPGKLASAQTPPPSTPALRKSRLQVAQRRDLVVSLRPTGWDSALDAVSISDKVPALPKVLDEWIDEHGFHISPAGRTWLRWARLHSSYVYENLGQRPAVGNATRNLLAGVGSAWLRVAMLDVARESGEFSTNGEASRWLGRDRMIRESLGTWAAENEIAVLGRGEQALVEAGQRSNSAETVGLQIIGALCLAVGNHLPAVEMVRTLPEPSPDIDWRALLQVSAKKREPDYQVSRTGPDHAAEFQVTVTVSERSASGRGTSKRSATAAAAEAWITRYAPQAIPSGAPRARLTTPLPIVVPAQHGETVRQVQRMFGLKVPDQGLLSQALIHASWAYENGRQLKSSRQRDLTILAHEGSQVLIALAQHEQTLSLISGEVADDDIRAATPTDEECRRLYDALQLEPGLLRGAGEATNRLGDELAADVAQAVVAAAWRSPNADLTATQPAVLQEWLRSIDHSLDPPTQLERYLVAIGQPVEVTYRREGADHDATYQADYVFPDGPMWRGHRRRNHSDAKKAAAATLLDLLVSDLGAADNAESAPNRAILQHLLKAEVTAVARQGFSGRERLLRTDRLVAGDLAGFESYAAAVERLANEADIVLPRAPLWGAYRQSAARARRTELADYTLSSLGSRNSQDLEEVEWSEGNLLRLAAIGEGLQTLAGTTGTLPEMIQRWNEAAESDCSVDSGQGHDEALIPGAASIASLVLDHADAAAHAVGQPVEVAVAGEDKSRVALTIRVGGVDLGATLGRVLRSASTIVPGVAHRTEADTLVVLLPIAPRTDSVLLSIGVEALEGALDDRWLSDGATVFARLGDALAAADHDNRSAAEQLNALARWIDSAAASTSTVRPEATDSARTVPSDEEGTPSRGDETVSELDTSTAIVATDLSGALRVDEPQRGDRRAEYRAFLTFTPHPETQQRVLEQVEGWLRGKGIDVGLAKPGVHNFSGRTVVSVHRDSSSGHDIRVRLVEGGRAEDTWLSEITVHLPTRGEGWVTVRVANSAGTKAAPPRLMADLVGVIEARDASMFLTPEPRMVPRDQVDDLLEAVCDPDRHGLVFVIGTANEEPLRFADIRRRAKVWSRALPGVAQMIILDPNATEAFNAGIGSTHAVTPWSIRTYAPDPDPAWASDAVRHKVMSAARIRSSSDQAILAILGNAAREQASARPVPRSVATVSKDLARLQESLVIDAVFNQPARDVQVDDKPTDNLPRAESVDTQADSSGPKPGTIPSQALPTEAPEQRPLGDEPSVAEGMAADLAESIVETAHLRGLLTHVQRVFGLRELTIAAIDDAAAAMHREREDAQRRAARVATIEANARELLETRAKELSDLRDEVDFYQLLADEADSLRDDAETLTGRANAEAQYLRRQLEAAGRHDTAWGVIPDDAIPAAPGSFEQLLECLQTDFNKRGIIFTGDASVTADLDSLDTNGRLVRSTWECLQTITGYVAARGAGVQVANLYDHLTTQPAGYPMISRNKYASKESESTMNRFGKLRIFPVPPDADPSCRVTMQAHFKIGVAGIKSPRMHILDDVSGTGKIYIGYIGPHLPTEATN